MSLLFQKAGLSLDYFINNWLTPTIIAQFLNLIILLFSDNSSSNKSRNKKNNDDDDFIDYMDQK